MEIRRSAIDTLRKWFGFRAVDVCVGLCVEQQDIMVECGNQARC